MQDCTGSADCGASPPAPFQRRTYSPRLIRPERSAGPDLTTSATASAPSMFVANRMPTPQWSLQKCSRVSAAQVLERVRVAPLHGTHAMRRCALHYRRCTSWRDCMPGIAATPSSTHAIVLEAPSQHLESQHPIRPSIAHASANVQKTMFKKKKEKKKVAWSNLDEEVRFWEPWDKASTGPGAPLRG